MFSFFRVKLSRHPSVLQVTPYRFKGQCWKFSSFFPVWWAVLLIPSRSSPCYHTPQIIKSFKGVSFPHTERDTNMLLKTKYAAEPQLVSKSVETKRRENVFSMILYRTQQASVLQAAPQSSRVLLYCAFTHLRSRSLCRTSVCSTSVTITPPQKKLNE